VRGEPLATRWQHAAIATSLFAKAGLRFAAIGDTNPADVHHLAELLRAA